MFIYNCITKWRIKRLQKQLKKIDSKRNTYKSMDLENSKFEIQRNIKRLESRLKD